MKYEEYQVWVYPDGDTHWHQNDRLHRVDGPAVEHTSGNKKWYQNGQFHRLDGPAIEYTDGYKEWWIKGKQFSEKEFLKKTKPSVSCDGKVVEIDGKKYKLTLVSEK